MNDIARVLRAAARRMLITGFLRSLIFLLAVALGAAIVGRAAEKLTVLSLPWREAAAYGAVGVVVLALLWSVVRAPRRPAVARRVDEGADLREALSTALWVTSSGNALNQEEQAWGRLAVETAAAKARGVEVRRAVPITPPRFWPVPLALALSLVVVWVAPRYDLFGSQKHAAVEDAKERKAILVVAKADEVQKKIEDLVGKPLKDLLKDEADAGADAEKSGKPQTPEEAQRSAVKKLTALKDKLEQLKAEGKGLDLKSLEDKLRQLKVPGQGPMTELSKELAKGNFQGAEKELEKVKAQIAQGKMSAEEKAKMAEQLQSLAEQLQKLGADQKEIEKKLEQAGLDKKLASDPEALKKALEQLQGLSDEQKKELMKQAQAAAKASEMAQGMAGDMQKMAKLGQQGKEGQQGDQGKQGQQPGKEGQEGQEGQEGMDGLGEKLSQFDKMSEESDRLQAAEGAIDAELGEGGLSDFPEPGEGMGDGESGGEGQDGEPADWKEGFGDETGPMGRGGLGRGSGRRGSVEAAMKWKKEKFKTQNTGGPIISTKMVEGEQVKGESRAEFTAAVSNAEQASTEAIEAGAVPRELQDPVKRYFGRLQQRAKGGAGAGGAGAGGAPPAKPAEPTGPVTPAQDAGGAKK